MPDLYSSDRVTVSFKDRPLIKVYRGTEVGDVLSAEERDLIERQKKAVYVNGFQESERYVMDSDCTLELRPFKREHMPYQGRRIVLVSKEYPEELAQRLADKGANVDWAQDDKEIKSLQEIFKNDNLIVKKVSGNNCIDELVLRLKCLLS